jgi:glucosamine-6-phosphate deaminase
MKVVVSPDAQALGQVAGKAAAEGIKNAIRERGGANIILATGTSQFETLKVLVADANIDWSKVVMFHLDEYMGLPVTAPASFRKYLRERVLDKLPPLKAVYLIDGEGDAVATCAQLGDAIRRHPIDVALVGIGENGHLAFNDPPADFDVTDPYIIVSLDEQCRQQQFNEGWFGSFETVPLQAISMSIHQIMLSGLIICSVPDSRKAIAVKNTLLQAVSNAFPASILRNHANCICYLDEGSASLIIHHFPTTGVSGRVGGT